MMKDQIGLLLTAIAVALAAWAFWHYLDSDAAAVLMLLVLVTSLIDNLRLRRKLREMQQRG